MISSKLDAVYGMFSRRKIGIVAMSGKDTAIAKSISTRFDELEQSVEKLLEYATDCAAQSGADDSTLTATYAVHIAFMLGTASMILCASGADELALDKSGSIWLMLPYKGWTRSGRVNLYEFISELSSCITKSSQRKYLCRESIDGIETFDVIIRHDNKIITVKRRANDAHELETININQNAIILADSNRQSILHAIGSECKRESALLITKRNDEISYFGPKACAISELPSPLRFITRYHSVPDIVVHTFVSEQDETILREWARIGVKIIALSDKAGFDRLSKRLKPEPNFDIKSITSQAKI